MHVRCVLVLLALGLTLLGCPDEITAPVPDGAVPCATRDDCNDGRSCGELEECVAMRCTGTATVVVPCE